MTFNKRLIIRTAATILLIEGIAMLIPLGTAFYDRTMKVFNGFAVSIAVLLSLAALGRIVTRKHKLKIKIRESYFIVLVGWLTMIAGGTLPYLLCGNGYTLVEGIFESIASWTTSSAWVIDVNTMPRALVLWKAISNWLGGMGIIVLAVVVFSALGVNGQKLAGAELRGPELEKHTAKMADTLRLIYIMYILMSLIELVLLLMGGLPKFVALINTMSTMSTSGIIDYRHAVATHFTPYVKVVLVIFSIMASLNFIVYIKIARRRFSEVTKDIELRVFFGVIAGATVFTSVILFIKGTYGSYLDALINSVTGVVSFSCTTGFPLEHVEMWPSICRMLMIILMFMGGCAYSTSGGIKVIRFMVLYKLIGRGVYKRIHPKSVKPVMIGDTAISTLNASSISAFILLFLGIYFVSAVILSLENFDMETTLSAPMALLTNCGVGFGRVSNAGYGIFSGAGKLYCAILMLLGRMEIYAFMILFSRSFWAPDRARN